jgi:hypothetical protein
MKDRLPTEFETMILKRIARSLGRFQSGDRQVQYIAAARRLERLGYAGKGRIWYVTPKGKEYLASLEQKKDGDQ